MSLLYVNTIIVFVLKNKCMISNILKYAFTNKRKSKIDETKKFVSTSISRRSETRAQFSCTKKAIKSTDDKSTRVMKHTKQEKYKREMCICMYNEAKFYV